LGYFWQQKNVAATRIQNFFLEIMYAIMILFDKLLTKLSKGGGCGFALRYVQIDKWTKMDNGGGAGSIT